ncbi:hypothetical protein [Pseudoalteromonas piscicida]|uniref:Polysaccharide biosynthesis protein n=1 Tax=Pseudoalteromonas piscicida TaxID=43662 RepID=A0A2A5JW26_PSEO7|nr:hypothetical protein [Pseudoalteromonas piscicida]PCK33608.1 hypothetical protein CEX98_00900 [Pseudoalteromonas piscicida]
MKFNFLHKVKWNAAGQLLHMVYGILLITLIVKSFGTESYAYYVYFQTILASALLVEFGVTSRILNLDKSVFKEKINDYFNAYYSTIVLLFIMSVVSLSCHFLPSDKLKEDYTFIFVISFLVVFNYGRSLFRAFLLRSHRDEEFNKLYIFFDVFRLLSCAALIYFEVISNIWEMLLQLVVITAVELILLAKGIDKSVWSIKPKSMLSFIKCARGNRLYYFYSLLAVAVFQIPYWIIPILDSNEAVALYAIAILPGSLLVTAFYPITSSLLPFLRDSNSSLVESKKFLYLILLTLVLASCYSLFLVINDFVFRLWLGDEFDSRVVGLSDGLFLFGLFCVVKSLYTVFLLSLEGIRQVVAALAVSIVLYYTFFYFAIEPSLEGLSNTLFLLPLMTIMLLVLFGKFRFFYQNKNHVLQL